MDNAIMIVRGTELVDAVV